MVKDQFANISFQCLVTDVMIPADLQNLNRSVSDDELTLQISVLENNRDDDFNELTVITWHLACHRRDHHV